MVCFKCLSMTQVGSREKRKSSGRVNVTKRQGGFVELLEKVQTNGSSNRVIGLNGSPTVQQYPFID